jgi:hypothetical protein
MTGSYQLSGPARICAVSGRELKPGDRFVSVLLDENGKFVRKDFAAEAWQKPEQSFVAYWAGRVPLDGKPAKPVINDELLVDCFEHLSKTNDDSRANFRYVVALLLMRRKRFKFEDAKKEGDTETLFLRDAKSGRRHEVRDPKLNDGEMESVQDEVFRVLGWE